MYIALWGKHIPIFHTLKLQVPKDCNFIININGSQKHSTIQVNIQDEAIASNLTIIGQNCWKSSWWKLFIRKQLDYNDSIYGFLWHTIFHYIVYINKILKPSCVAVLFMKFGSIKICSFLPGGYK